PQQLVAAKGYEVGAALQAEARGQLILNTKGPEVHHAAAAQILHQDELVLPGQLRQFLQAWPFGETHDTEITGMHPQEHARAFIDGGGIVTGSCSVGGADFAQHRSALRADIWDAEGASNFNQLTARNNDF